MIQLVDGVEIADSPWDSGRVMSAYGFSQPWSSRVIKEVRQAGPVISTVDIERHETEGKAISEWEDIWETEGTGMCGYVHSKGISRGGRGKKEKYWMNDAGFEPAPLLCPCIDCHTSCCGGYLANRQDESQTNQNTGSTDIFRLATETPRVPLNH